MAVQIEAEERSDRGLELRVGESYRIKIGTGFCAATLRRLLEVLGKRLVNPIWRMAPGFGKS